MSDDRRASCLVCDDVLFSVNGKFTAIGIYSSDIVIPVDPTTVPQLVFLFDIACPRDDVFQTLIAQVTFPEQEPRRITIPFLPAIVQQSALAQPDRTHVFSRWPFLISQPVLKPGRLESKIVHEKGELVAAYNWITLPPIAQVN
jgi:hypothetical protein